MIHTSMSCHLIILCIEQTKTKNRASQGIGRKIAVRTRFFDDFLLDCCTDIFVSAQPPRSRRWLRALFPFNWLLRRRQRPRQPRTAPIKQVLILGCGMDTRAWRLPLNDNVVVEVDVAPVLRAKDGVLKELQGERRRANMPEVPLTVRERRPVPADLADPDDDWPARVARVLDPAQPVAVILEGLLMYLGEEEVRALLARVGALAAAPGSRVGISLVDRR
jgi:O-methyltransferase involved in polyketide biosynthesis